MGNIIDYSTVMVYCDREKQLSKTYVVSWKVHMILVWYCKYYHINLYLSIHTYAVMLLKSKQNPYYIKRTLFESVVYLELRN